MATRCAALCVLLVSAGGGLAAQAHGPPAAIAVLNLRFDGEHANVLEPGDTAVAAAATSRLLATLRAAEAVRALDSGLVASAVEAAEADGNPCDRACALTVARRLGAAWVTIGTVTKTSNLVWLLSAQLFSVTTGKTVLSDAYELKGDASRIAPAGAHVFAQRVEKAIAAARQVSADP